MMAEMNLEDDTLVDMWVSPNEGVSDDGHDDFANINHAYDEPYGEPNVKTTDQDEKLPTWFATGLDDCCIVCSVVTI